MLPFSCVLTTITDSFARPVTFLRTSVLPKPPAAPAKGAAAAAAAQPQSAGMKASKTIQVSFWPLQIPFWAPAGPVSVAAAKWLTTLLLEQTWVKANYEKAMLFVAFVEVVVVFGRILLGAITFQNSCVPCPSLAPLPCSGLPCPSPPSHHPPS